MECHHYFAFKREDFPFRSTFAIIDREKRVKKAEKKENESF